MRKPTSVFVGSSLLALNQLLVLLGELHDVAPGRRKALRARLKHLQSLGYPRGVNTGRGRAVTYEASQIFELNLALEFAQIGIAPETVVRLMRADGDRVRSALRLVFTTIQDPASTIFLYVDPNALSALSDDRSLSLDTLHYAGVAQMKENLGCWHVGGLRRIALIDLSAIIRGIGAVLPVFGEHQRDDFLNSLSAWVDDEDARAAEDGDDQEA